MYKNKKEGKKLHWSKVLILTVLKTSLKHSTTEYPGNAIDLTPCSTAPDERSLSTQIEK